MSMQTLGVSLHNDIANDWSGMYIQSIFFFFFADMPHHSYGSPFSPQNKIIKIPATFYLTNTLNSFVAINIRSINKNTIKSMIRNVIMKQIQMVWNPTTGNQNRKKINFHITHWHLLVHCKKRL